MILASADVIFTAIDGFPACADQTNAATFTIEDTPDASFV
jgi:hypothetical protein